MSNPTIKDDPIDIAELNEMFYLADSIDNALGPDDLIKELVKKAIKISEKRSRRRVLQEVEEIFGEEISIPKINAGVMMAFKKAASKDKMPIKMSQAVQRAMGYNRAVRKFKKSLTQLREQETE